VRQTVGILALQGDFQKHQNFLKQLNVTSLLVKKASDLAKIDRLIMPGGESTTMTLLLKRHGLFGDVANFCQYYPVYGTCAGAILLARYILPDEQTMFGQIDMCAKRNDYGRQINSFIADITFNNGKQEVPFKAVFIRAPVLTDVNQAKANVLARFQDHPVLVQQGHAMASSFHPELTDDPAIHEYFLSI
jgi:5'-phosphate synthase pdxT subunit